MQQKLRGRPGFTLLEVLIIMAILAILMSFVFLKLKPFARKQQAFDLERRAAVRSIESGVAQYVIDTLNLPPGTPVGKPIVAKNICRETVQGTECTIGAGGVDLSGLVPKYLQVIPVDPSATGALVTGYKLYSDGEDVFALAPSMGASPTKPPPGQSSSSGGSGGSGTLIAKWRLDETSGTTASDSSGNGYSATLVNGPSWTSGIINGAVQFDATNDELSVPDNMAFDGLGAFTLSAWIYPYSLRDTQIAGISDVYYLKLQSDGHIQFAAKPMVNSSVSLSTVPINQWTFVALRYDGSKVELFFNGVSDSTVNATGNVAVTTTPFRMGAANTFHGKIDEVRLDRTALSSSAILAMHRDLFPNSQVAYWKFDEGNGTSTADATGNGRTATLQNGVAWNNVSLPPLTYTNAYSLKFDGVDDFVDVPYHSSINFSGPNGFTATAWAYLDSSMPNSAIAGMRTNSTQGWLLYVVSNRVGLELNGNSVASDASTTISSPGWYHIAGVWDGQKTKFYLNGVLKAEHDYASPPNISGTYPLSIGRFLYWGVSGSGYYFDDKIDDVRLYNRPLSAAEIKVFGTGDPPL